MPTCETCDLFRHGWCYRVWQTSKVLAGVWPEKEACEHYTVGADILDAGEALDAVERELEAECDS